MLTTQIKNKEEIISKLSGSTFIIKCIGCKEVLFPETEIDKFISENIEKNKITGRLKIDYLCNQDFSQAYINNHKVEIEKAETILVFSCGVGVQVMASLLENKKVITGCDTIYINGFQGLTVQNYNCAQCGNCYLNYTAGICPITACSKGLLNGSCGGAKNGKCEVNKDFDCGWEKIYNRLLKLNKKPKEEILIRDYSNL
ncbi:MAG: hypothetical protein A2474_04295 [Elusimicrobia bacterium RIFOXYC2_FULL_34_12]|nr:MAG: hypothetical protein A2474_04295 [Elusimicrobia bacterium RIFOXYC2_FULL_34_12]OGS38106.1 MAG: hypothetical protein A2551_02740 [Elusimicrobia bacterium RIFOXYD2_FULL_34_30]